MVALFTASWVWRRYVVETKAQSLGLLEQTHGDVSAADRTVELLLTGSRGLFDNRALVDGHGAAEEESVERPGTDGAVADAVAAALHHALAVPELESRL